MCIKAQWIDKNCVLEKDTVNNNESKLVQSRVQIFLSVTKTALSYVVVSGN